MKKVNWIGVLVILLIGCRSIQPVDEPTLSKLTPYVQLENTAVPLDISTPEPELEPTIVPTAAPIIHIVALGETISSIALQYGLTMDAVRKANPDANPNALIVGDELVIPINGSFTITAFDPEIGRNVQFSDPNCVPSRDTGVWCAVLVENLGENDLENMIVAFSFLDLNGNLIEENYAPTMMRFSSAGSSNPAVFFMNAAPANFIRAAPSLFSAQVVNTSSKHYLPIEVEEETRLLSGMEATISGTMRVESDQEVDRADIWIGAAAFDAEGVLIGVRRIDSEVATNESFSYDITVYAAESSISRVELYSEAF